MHPIKLIPRGFLLIIGIVIAGCQTGKHDAPSPSDPLKFTVTFPESVHEEAISARVLLMLSKSERGEPRLTTDWFNLEPVFAIDAEDFKPGDSLVFTPSKFKKPDALAFPGSLGSLEPGHYRAQVLIDLDQTRRSFVSGPGNLYSKPVDCEIRGSKGGTYELVADQIVKEEEEPTDSEWVKFIKVRSAMLSDFHGRDVYLRAAVMLPHGYGDDTETTYPTLYSIPGFGGRHDGLVRTAKSSRYKDWRDGKWPLKHLLVRLDPDVPLGHSVFANSINNGPVGDALVEELIPAIENRFRAVAEPRARFLSGHSSGGWSSLWLQVTYPDFFGGCWSTAPDPVDFRAYQTINIYEDTNGLWTEDGYPRPVARDRNGIQLTLIKMHHWEYVVGYGGQLDSFDAVFGPRTLGGFPKPLIHKLTGAIDPAVAEYWKAYDIRMVLEDNWEILGPKLQDKLHVIGGAWDSFYLEDAVEHLRDFLATKDHGGYVEIMPGSHGSFYDDDLAERIREEMAAQYKATPQE